MNGEPLIRTYTAPAKLNLSLLVSPPTDDGYHPLESLVQTVDWHDTLTVEAAEEFHLESDLELDGENLVETAWRSVAESHDVPASSLLLQKQIPVGAGLGGGSSDAAAALLAATRVAGLSRDVANELAPRIGADVPLFLVGGSLLMRGRGDRIDPVPPLSGFAVAVVVPTFELSTAAVYARWDDMEGPIDPPVDETRLPPALRGGIPIRNDLLSAALSLEPALGDFMADVRARWDTPVLLTGSGSACFGLFPTVGEAMSAAAEIGEVRAARGVALRRFGITENVSTAQ